jgi:hypothetical protein
MSDNEKYEYNERSESNVNRAASDAMNDKAKKHLQTMEKKLNQLEIIRIT